MKLLIDDANTDKIRELWEIYPLDGVSTNPTILSKYNRPPFEVLKEIREIIGPDADLHVQVTARDADGMLEDARKIQEVVGKNTYIKVPTIPEGLKAMKMIKADGGRVTATAIYTPMQAYLAGKAGADFVAPYVNRIDNLGADGIETTKAIEDIFENNGMDTQILAASFKNSQQVQELARYGVGASTCAPDVIENLMKNPAVDAAVEVFLSDFEKLVGPGKTMKDC